MRKGDKYMQFYCSNSYQSYVHHYTPFARIQSLVGPHLIARSSRSIRQGVLVVILVPTNAKPLLESEYEMNSGISVHYLAELALFEFESSVFEWFLHCSSSEESEITTFLGT